MNEIVPCQPDVHWPQIWSFLQPVFAAGESYPVAIDVSELDARNYWFSREKTVFVAVERKSGKIRGTYYIRPNSESLGAHICNCGYIVDPDSRGLGIATAMCRHSQSYARKQGFRGMQYNLVVSTNHGAVRLWQSQGFDIIGTLPGAFNHKAFGYVDAHVMFKSLVD